MEMTKEQKIQHYATAKRATAGKITQIVNRKFKSFWVGKLRGTIVSHSDGNYRFNDRQAALECARGVRGRCRTFAKQLGIGI